VDPKAASALASAITAAPAAVSATMAAPSLVQRAARCLPKALPMVHLVPPSWVLSEHSNGLGYKD